MVPNVFDVVVSTMFCCTLILSRWKLPQFTIKIRKNTYSCCSDNTPFQCTNKSINLQ
jgi:hypothetical protein